MQWHRRSAGTVREPHNGTARPSQASFPAKPSIDCGSYCRLEPNGYEPCNAGGMGTKLDYNRPYRACRWDVASRRLPLLRPVPGACKVSTPSVGTSALGSGGLAFILQPFLQVRVVPELPWYGCSSSGPGQEELFDGEALRRDHVGARQVCLVEVGLVEGGVVEVRTTEVGSFQVCSEESGFAFEAGLGEICFT